MNNELEWIRKEFMTGLIEMLPWNLLEVIEESYEHQGIRFSG
jgi:hypothetical protein